MTTIKLTRDMTSDRVAGRDRLDAVFMPYLDRLLTTKRSLYALKSAEAVLLVNGSIKTSSLLGPEADRLGVSERDFAVAVLTKAIERNADVAEIETERQVAQAEIDTAATPAAIDAVLSRYAAQLAAAYPAVIG